jgi:hypothetical protein
VVEKESANTCVEGEEVCTNDAGAKESHPENAAIDSDTAGPDQRRNLEMPLKTADQEALLELYPPKTLPPGRGE